MFDIKKIDSDLYNSLFGVPRSGDFHKIWNKIKNSPEILQNAVKIVRNNYDNGYTLLCPSICNMMLIDHNDIDDNIYYELIDAIYSNVDIARMTMGSGVDGGFSFLLLSLWNKDLVLTDDQKFFAVNEAMNKVGTSRWRENKDYFSNIYSKHDFGHNIKDSIDTCDCISPIRLKDENQYIRYVFANTDSAVVHGTGAFDIRYHILNNRNWNLDEKKNLIKDFWIDDEIFDTYLMEWEWSIINDPNNFVDDYLPILDMQYLYNYSYDNLLDFYGDINVTNRIWNEICFCKMMHELRPLELEKDFMIKRLYLS